MPGSNDYRLRLTLLSRLNRAKTREHCYRKCRGLGKDIMRSIRGCLRGNPWCSYSSGDATRIWCLRKYASRAGRILSGSTLRLTISLTSARCGCPLSSKTRICFRASGIINFHDSTSVSADYLVRGYFWCFWRRGRREESKSVSPVCPSPRLARSRVWSAVLSRLAASVAKSSCHCATPMPRMRASMYWVTRVL